MRNFLFFTYFKKTTKKKLKNQKHVLQFFLCDWIWLIVKIFYVEELTCFSVNLHDIIKASGKNNDHRVLEQQYMTQMSVYKAFLTY